MEVMCGAESQSERIAAKMLLDSMRMVPLSAEVAGSAVEAGKRLHLKLPDAVIYATADTEGCILVTRNSKDFDPSDPLVRIPY